MDKLATLWAFVCRRKYLITLVVFVVIVGFLDENSIVRRMGYANEISRLNNEIEKYRAEYEENTERLNELAVDSGAIERIAREKYLMKKPNEDIYVFEEDIENEIPDTCFVYCRRFDGAVWCCRLYYRLGVCSLCLYDWCHYGSVGTDQFTFQEQ